jgi:phospholipid/cholesterol/gamma-HCH transport system substrate-binding protein
MKRAALALFAVLLLGAGVFIFLRSLESRFVTIRAYTDDAGGLSEGTSVRLNGISIGDIDKLNLTTSRDPKRKIEVIMKVDRRHLSEIPDDSLVGQAASNMLGNYFIDIFQGRSPRPVEPGGELQTTVGVDPNKLMGSMASEFQQIQNIFNRANRLIQDVQAGQGNVGLMAREGSAKMNAVSSEFDRLSASIRDAHGNLSKVDDLKAQIDSTTKRLDEITSHMQSDQGAMGRMKSISGEISQMSTEMNQVTAAMNSPQGPSARLKKIQEGVDALSAGVQTTVDRIHSGQGTLGQFTVNPQFSEALAHTSADFQSLARDIRANPRKFLSLNVKFF